MKPIAVMRARGVAGGGGGMVFANYAAYAAYAESLTVASSQYRPVTSGYPLNAILFNGLTRFKVDDCALAASGLWGSPASSNRCATNDSSIAGFLLHCVETTGSVASGSPNIFLIQSASGTFSNYLAVTKNGQTSSAYAPSYNGYQASSVVYWDYNLGRARKFDATTLSYSDYTG